MNEPTAENRARVGGSWRPAPGDRVSVGDFDREAVVLAVDGVWAWCRWLDASPNVAGHLRPLSALAPWEPRRCDACGQEVTA